MLKLKLVGIRATMAIALLLLFGVMMVVLTIAMPMVREETCI